MLIKQKNSEKLAIYFFFDKEGKVDKYVTYFLKEMRLCVNHLVVVCNGNLADEEKSKIEPYSNQIIERENIGFDVWAYRSAIQLIGWEQIQNYDELIILNSTIMGPVYSLQEMFSEMAIRDLDFWGINKHFGVDFDPFGCCPYGYLPDHLQSHFLVFRKNIISSKIFQQFWDEMPMIHSYQESVGLFESYLTKYFSENGFSWDSYVNTDDLRQITIYPLMTMPKELIINRKCPIFKRRSFFQPYDYMLWHTTGEPTIELFDYLNKNGIYDVDMIWENILRTCKQEDYSKVLHLNYILSSNNLNSLDIKNEKLNLALLIDCKDKEFIGEIVNYIQMMPLNTDVFILTNTKSNQEKIESYHDSLKDYFINIQVVKDNEDSEKFIELLFKDILQKYKYICCVNDYYKHEKQYNSTNISKRYKNFVNILYNKVFILNILDIFEKEKRLGILFPPLSNNGEYFINNNIQDKAELFFWVRTESLQSIVTDKSVQISDYSHIAQKSGYYSAIVMSDFFGKIEHTNLSYYIEKYNNLFLKYGIENNQQIMLEEIEKNLSRGIKENRKHSYKSRIRNKLSSTKKRIKHIFYNDYYHKNK